MLRQLMVSTNVIVTFNVISSESYLKKSVHKMQHLVWTKLNKEHCIMSVLIPILQPRHCFKSSVKVMLSRIVT